MTPEQIARAKEMAAEIERLQAALQRYGTHVFGCRLTAGGDRCTCGLDAALKGGAA